MAQRVAGDRRAAVEHVAAEPVEQADVHVHAVAGAVQVGLGHEGGLEAVLLRHALHDALEQDAVVGRSEEHTSELQSLMRISYAVFCLKKKITTDKQTATELKDITNSQEATSKP